MTKSQWALRRRATSRIFHEPLPFRHEMDVLACGIKYLSPWCMIFVDDNVLCSTRREDVETKLRQGLNISRKKTVYKKCNVHLHGDIFERVTAFKYLVSTLAENGALDADMTHVIQS